MDRGLKLGAVGIALLVDLGASFVLGTLGGAGYGFVLGVSGNPAPDPVRMMTSPPMLWIMLFAGLGGSAIGGFAAARLARHAPLLHGAALAIVALALALLLTPGGSMEGAPAWYGPAGLIGSPIATMLGALLVPREAPSAARFASQPR